MTAPTIRNFSLFNIPLDTSYIFSPYTKEYGWFFMTFNSVFRGEFCGGGGGGGGGV